MNTQNTRKPLSKLTSVILSVALILSMTPMMAFAEDSYNAHDVGKVQAFLEQEDEQQKTNAQKLNCTANDPTTWNFAAWTNADENGEKRLQELTFNPWRLGGDLDLSGCTALTELICDNNSLTGLDVSGCTVLTKLDCYQNNLTHLDVSECEALTELNCYANNLTSLNVSECEALTSLNCRDNNLTYLDVSDCTPLTMLNCDDNSLSALNVSGSTDLEELNCYGNNLTSLDVSKCTKLLKLDCSGNDLTSLDVSNCTQLAELYCTGNNLSSLNVTRNILLEWISCYDNNLIELDISKCTELVGFDCSENNLSSLNVSRNTKLEWIYCYDNNLTGLDVSKCTNLVELYTEKNPLNVASLNAIKGRTYPFAFLSYTEDGNLYYIANKNGKTFTVKSEAGGNAWGVIENDGNSVRFYYWSEYGYKFEGYDLDDDKTAGIDIESIDFDGRHYVADSTATNMSLTLKFVRDDDVAIPGITGVTPSGSGVSASTNKLTITFNMAMSPDDGKVAVSGGASLGSPSWSNDGKTVTYDLSGLAAGKTYTVYARDFWDVDGYTNIRDVFTFSTTGGGGPSGSGSSGSSQAPEQPTQPEQPEQPKSWVNPFTDVRESDWFYGDVEYAVTKGLFSGTSSATFSPNALMTRGMLVTALGRLHGVDVGEYTGSSFNDVAPGQYYAAYVEWAKENGIVDGVGEGRFASDVSVSRQDMTVILSRYLAFVDKDLPDQSDSAVFNDDGSIAAYAKEAVYAMQRAGIVSGKPGNLFDPRGDATRAQAAAILARLAGAMAK